MRAAEATVVNEEEESDQGGDCPEPSTGVVYFSRWTVWGQRVNRAIRQG